MSDIIITKLCRTPDGVLEARVSVAGDTVEVTRCFGSWGTKPGPDGSWRDCLPPVAAALQVRAKRFEHAEAEWAK